jgi:predicted nucleotidyltransferase
MQSTYDKIQFYKLQPRQKNKIIAQIKKTLNKENRIKLAILFGSLRTRNSIRDIDLCIYTKPTLKFQELLNLNAQIELELGIPTDLVELAHLPPTLKTNILKNGIPIKGQKTLINKLLNQTQTEQIHPTPS